MKQDDDNIYKQILELALSGYWDWNIESGDEYMSPAFKKMFGYEDHELLNRVESCQRMILPEDLNGVLVKFKRHVESRGKVPYYNEVRYRHKDGSIVWVLCTGRVIEWADNGEPKRMVGCHVDITQRKKAEEKLVELGTRLRTLSDNLPGGLVYQIDSGADGTDRRFVYVSGGVQQLHEVSAEEVLKDPMKIYGQVPASERIRVADLEVLALKSMSVFSIETSFVLPSGRVRYGLLTSSPRRLPNGHIIWDGVEIDITDRKMVEEALKDSESRLRAFMDNMPSMVVIKDNELRPCYFNRAFLEYFPGREWLHKTPHETFPKEIADEIQKADLKAISEKFISYEEKWTDKHGVERTLDTRKFAIPSGDESPYLGVIISDITQRKQVEDALAAEKERLAVTLSSIGDGVITTDNSGTILTINKIAEELTGWPENEARGRQVSEVFNVVNEITRQRCVNPVEQVLESGTAVNLPDHTLLIARAGRRILLSSNGAPISDKDGRVVGVVLAFHDITEQQKLIESAQRADKLEAIGLLAGGIAHDFNNLLGGIFGYIDMALSSSNASDVERCLNASLSTINRARGLTQQLLTFAKGGLPNRRVERLFPFIQETVQFAMSGSSISCSFAVPNDLWLCNIDKGQVGQVIDNLVLNAQQAMPLGGNIDLMARNVSLGEKAHPVLEKGDYVQISIRDHGIGMPKEILPRIFDPFFTTKPKGHGLGLATCYSIINRHGGCIDVESETGVGSTFHLYLPAARNAISSDTVEVVVAHKGTGTVVVMDDEKVIRDVVAGMLKSFGYTPVCMTNGNDALVFFEAEIKANRKVKAMIFDLTIPGGMGGKEAITAIRKICKETPVIVASGYADDPIMANPEEYGFTNSIRKPFMRVEIAKILNDCLKSQE
ncbi:MAG: hypothetical protein A2283_00535 [Lentisphaerae bacterium RIFOXYA12_FULL_48_11]|nr:MAG: hypothetical protein A2283_00535 [Lentisphaerae bacterium RIFOXYA12_FULL_48_11]